MCQANLPQSVLARLGMFLFEYIKVNEKGGALSEIGGWSHSSYTTAELPSWSVVLVVAPS
jgi:hypothetical protein